MKNICLVANLDRDIDGRYLREVIDWLKKQGISAIVGEREAKVINNDAGVAFGDELYEKSDMVVSLGGDGTMIAASKKASVYNVPVMGINLGTLGYLTDAAGGKAGLSALEKVVRGDYKTEKRMMIEAAIFDQDRNVVKDGLLALNDVCVLRGNVPKAKVYSLQINGECLDKYKSDGIIVATPTGSTAYNLSAGGSILSPDIECVSITPICSHNLSSRPLVVSAHDIISIKAFGDYWKDNENEVIVSLDCQENVGLREGYSVQIQKAKNYATHIKTNDLGFYDIIRMKMH